jgi:hypothetical protein
LWAKEFKNAVASKHFTLRPGQILVNEKINAIVMGGYLDKWNPVATHTFAVGLLKTGLADQGVFLTQLKID